MSSAIPGHAHAVPGSGPRSAPVARISRTVLTANARTAWDRGIRSYDASILDADAWGHGLELVRDVLATVGLEARTRHVGVTAADSAPIAARSDTLSAAALLGLPGAAHAAVPALRLTGTVLSVKDLREGEGVSYGYAYRAPADTRVALVTGGYAQGIVRALGGAVDVAIAGERHPVVGRVAMDVCVVDIRDAAVRRGDEVLFLGDPADGEPSLADWVRETGLTAGELVTMVGLRAGREETP
ncbi:alanine racemase [Microbacterium trichothecenolyticum]|uniref:alanine racemase C-terminal domain-containing protein n=1 Tax=Microbacterium trichothecenolyticum TaxID=69370 RepID=UPI00285D70A0|nr:alanine racemase C-terminal domain-containing protein [Microbacterium trichothecenolyticum]MDR7186122.1 alanine racemase [Microbacterium trichothecenolyticum]